MNGKEQTARWDPDFSDVKADRFTLEGKTVRVSFTALYPPAAGLKKLERTVSVTEDRVALCDEFDFTGEKNAVSEHFATLYEPKIEEGRAILGDFVLEAEGACTVSCDSVSFAGDEKLTRCWKQDTIYRVRFDFVCKENVGISVRLFKRK